MMVVPINAQKYETKQVAQKHGNQWNQGGGICFVRCSQFHHHNGDDDGNHTIAKCFHASLSHWLIFIIDIPIVYPPFIHLIHSSRGILTNASTTSGSNCCPAVRLSSAEAASKVLA